ncbi:type III secretion system chaperone [Mailhella massiliensis]|uniref:Type III secretion system chaperone n=1 Tax=Mailhella massiliensis TaxID=1903261 RepID=A0A921AV06_9BACT|nr:type III secretion system chaperone [Mailhella massiliensis]HJD96400.1 type III secretion system chaperone [Mailhella massiliensis]
MSEAFTSLLHALAPALGLPEVTVQEEDSSCLLVIDDFEVSLRYLPGSDLVMMFTVVVPLPEKNREALYAALLDANTFFHETQGFTLAAREDTGVTLQGVMPMRVLDGGNIASWVQNFVAIAESWQSFCLRREEENTPEGSSAVLPQDMLQV